MLGTAQHPCLHHVTGVPIHNNLVPINPSGSKQAAIQYPVRIKVGGDPEERRQPPCLLSTRIEQCLEDGPDVRKQGGLGCRRGVDAVSL